ncbi:MAG: DivIVA domain-containing protein [bacterium]
MKLTPLDIKKQEFKKTIRGFDPIEVETFLEMVAEEYENLIREKNHLADEVLQLKTQLHDYKDVEKTLQETLVTAQQTISDSRENSAREAETIIHEAEIKAENLLQETKLQLAELKNDIVLLKAQKESFARRLKHLLESQLELMEVLEMDDLGYKKMENKPESPRVVSEKPEADIEFEGIDDMLPDDASTANEKVSSLEAEAAEEKELANWPQQTQKPDEKKDEDAEHDPPQKSRISDRLIF